MGTIMFFFKLFYMAVFAALAAAVVQGFAYRWPQVEPAALPIGLIGLVAAFLFAHLVYTEVKG